MGEIIVPERMYFGMWEQQNIGDVRGVAWPFWCCRPFCNMQVLCTVWAECVNELG